MCQPTDAGCKSQLYGVLPSAAFTLFTLGYHLLHPVHSPLLCTSCCIQCTRYCFASSAASSALSTALHLLLHPMLCSVSLTSTLTLHMQTDSNNVQ